MSLILHDFYIDDLVSWTFLERDSAFHLLQSQGDGLIAISCPPLFGRFVGTMASSDFSSAYMLGVRLSLPISGTVSQLLAMRSMEVSAWTCSFEHVTLGTHPLLTKLN